MLVGAEPVEASDESVRRLVQRAQRAVTGFAMEDVVGDAVNVRVAEVAHSEGTQFCRRGASREVRYLIHGKPRRGMDLPLVYPNARTLHRDERRPELFMRCE